MDDDAIRDVFSGLGSVSIRRMFGGKGIYHEGRIFALEVGGELLLKADAETAETFRAAGSKQWVYDSVSPKGVRGPRRKKPVAMPYWSIPETAIDDPDEMLQWARLAYQAAMRADLKAR